MRVDTRLGTSKLYTPLLWSPDELLVETDADEGDMTPSIRIASTFLHHVLLISNRDL